jgi:hypothetical protein
MFDMDGSIDAMRIDESIELLNQHLDAEAIAPLISVLQAIADNPYDASLLDQLSEVFADMGFLQGAILTYAPYVAIILPDDPFADLDDDPFDDIE